MQLHHSPTERSPDVSGVVIGSFVLSSNKPKVITQPIKKMKTRILGKITGSDSVDKAPPGMIQKRVLSTSVAKPSFASASLLAGTNSSKISLYATPMSFCKLRRNLTPITDINTCEST